jgi:hypothetical protein
MGIMSHAKVTTSKGPAESFQQNGVQSYNAWTLPYTTGLRFIVLTENINNMF